MLAHAGIADDPTGGVAVLLITTLGVAFLPFAFMFAGGWKLLCGIVILAVDAFIVSRSGRFALRWQRQRRVPEALMGFGVIIAALLGCIVFHGLLLVSFTTFTRHQWL